MSRGGVDYAQVKPSGGADVLSFLMDKPLSGALAAALLIGVCALLFVPSDVVRVSRALASREPVSVAGVPHFVHRSVIDDIVAAIELGDNFVVVEGDNRVGKTIAVLAAASHLSRSRAVLWCNCTHRSTLESTLQTLYGLERNTLVDRVFDIVSKSVGPPPDVQRLILSRGSVTPEPVLVVEEAEQLPLGELKALVIFAKRLADAKPGRFVFVVSPSDELNDIDRKSVV